MSKIKIVGHASGTGVLTIAAPNTNTDRTITIPDVTGTLLDSGSNLPAANLTGTIASARLPTSTDLPLAGGTMTGNISHAGAFTLDVGSEINLDSDSGYVYLKDAGTSIGLFKLTSSDFYIKSVVSDKDIIFQGNDGGSGIEAMRIDMSAGGNVGIKTSAPISLLDITHTATSTPKTNLTLSASSIQDGGGTGIFLKTSDNTTEDRYGARIHTIRGSSGVADLVLSVESGSGLTEGMRIDSSGNVGVGGTSLGSRLHVNDVGGTSHGLTLRHVTNDVGKGFKILFKAADTGGNIVNYGEIKNEIITRNASSHSGAFIFNNAVSGTLTERMRIDSAGTTTTGVGYISRDVANYATSAATAISTATLKLKTHSGDSTLTSFGGMSGGITYIQRTNGSGSATYPIALNPYGGKVNIGDGTPHFSDAMLRIMQSNSYPFIELNMTGTGSMGAVKYENGNGTVGSISMYSNSVSFNTSSDYRLKENVDYTWDATTRLKQLKPARFNFISDDTNTLVDGFIAHEVSSVVPEAIFGTKDAMTAEVLYVEGDELPEGKSVGDVKTVAAIDPQGIDQSKLVPLLVKTIQELEARITALEA